MMDWKSVVDYAVFIAAAAAILGGLYIARNKAVVENYRTTVDSQNVRLTAQAADIESLKTDNIELARRLDELAGQREGYEFAAEVFARAVASAGICAIAWECTGRILPDMTAKVLGRRTGGSGAGKPPRGHPVESVGNPGGTD